MKNAGKLSKWIEITVGKSLFPTVFSRDFYCRHLKIRAYLGDGQDLHGCANDICGFVEVDYYFYTAKTQKGHDGIVSFESYGLNWAMKLIEVQNANLTKADLYP